MKTKVKWPWVVAGMAIAALVLIFALWRAVTASEMGITILSRSPLLPSSRLVANLASNDPDTVRESLAVLNDRADPSGVQAAIPLLKSRDPYVWFNAALYLGAMRRQEAVPYLIKGLRHPAWRAHQDSANRLTAITGQNFGTDFEKWREWWEKSNPGATFDFDSDLGR
jgi:hypothetical protein